MIVRPEQPAEPQHRTRMASATLVSYPEPAATPHVHQLYGIRVRSTLPLAGPCSVEPGPADVELRTSPSSLFDSLPGRQPPSPEIDDWFQHLSLPDGSDYLRWTGLFEFLVSPDGQRIACHALKGASHETFQTYLASQALSFALLKQGIEPLHATTVVIRGQAVAFLGNCKYGKSSLGAAFIRAGHRLLTDDVLVTSPDPGQRNRMLAHPGPPRIKLFPAIAARLLGRRRSGVPMNPDTRKLILPLAHSEHCDTAVPLAAIYVLRPPASRPASTRAVIRTLSPRQACLKLIANTFNTIVTKPARLARQFNCAAQLVAAVPVKSLSYPRRLAHIPAVVAAIHKDLAQ